ncbi:leucine-rich repeat-domain-containing protein [Dunaliella salina]|uniref:Leucine-rich repeat-domain-containing protein n=1 Tax=Dunaliella salina TaxID=3046 RepID=A0ABQ7GBW1_DUNSA|nr:leucine-rich repeat-domain-containing protein [Dunaliella salina]|eukprot:KAF5832091.1 leucine-rich repeat-domain-containing protein [Dunaliella salina]
MDRSAGALGPRLAGRLTAELILRSPQYMSTLHLYELELRGNKIAAIENLGVTENQFDSIDLTDNAIVKLDGFPKLPRLKQLLLNNNRIARIAKGCSEAIPNLETLVLTNNRLCNLQDLEPLGSFSKLTLLSLVGNPVQAKPNYRLYLISICKSLKILDFKKVKQQERIEAKKMFATAEEAVAHGAKTFEPTEDLEAAKAQAGQAATAQQQQQQQQAQTAAPTKPKGPSPEQLLAIKAAIANAATMEEIRALEESLSQPGHLPSEVSIAEQPAGQQTGGGDQQMEEAGGKERGSEQPQQQQQPQQGIVDSQPENMAVG